MYNKECKYVLELAAEKITYINRLFFLFSKYFQASTLKAMQTKKIMFSAFQDEYVKENESTSNDNYLTFTKFLVNEGKLIVQLFTKP